MTTIPASRGAAYEVSCSGGVIILDRRVRGVNVRHLFGPVDALAVADALVDAAESMQ